MPDRNEAITSELYKLVCDLKLMLLQIGKTTIDHETHSSVMRLLVAMKKYCSFFDLQQIARVSQNMENIWRTIQPGEIKFDAVTSLLRTADELSSELSPHNR